MNIRGLVYPLLATLVCIVLAYDTLANAISQEMLDRSYERLMREPARDWIDVIPYEAQYLANL